MEPVRLTQFSPGAGCGCKISPAQLRQILQESLPGRPKKDLESKGNSAREQGANVAGLDKGPGNQRAAEADLSKGAIEFPQLLVGYESCDDAAVYDIGSGKAVISTTDAVGSCFFAASTALKSGSGLRSIPSPPP